MIMPRQPNNNIVQERSTKCRPNPQRRRALRERGIVWSRGVLLQSTQYQSSTINQYQSTQYNIIASQNNWTTWRQIQRIRVGYVRTINMIGMQFHCYLIYPGCDLCEDPHTDRRLPRIWIYLQSLLLPECRRFMESTCGRMLLTPQLYVPDQLVNLTVLNYNDLPTFYPHYSNPHFTAVLYRGLLEIRESEHHVPECCELEPHLGQVFTVSSQQVERPNSPYDLDAESIDSEDIMDNEEQNTEDAVPRGDEPSANLPPMNDEVQNTEDAVRSGYESSTNLPSMDDEKQNTEDAVRSGNESSADLPSNDIGASSGDTSTSSAAEAEVNPPVCVFCRLLHEAPEFYPVEYSLCPFLKTEERHDGDKPDWPEEFCRNDDD